MNRLAITIALAISAIVIIAAEEEKGKSTPAPKPTPTSPQLTLEQKFQLSQSLNKYNQSDKVLRAYVEETKKRMAELEAEGTKHNALVKELLTAIGCPDGEADFDLNVTCHPEKKPDAQATPPVPPPAKPAQ